MSIDDNDQTDHGQHIGPPDTQKVDLLQHDLDVHGTLSIHVKRT